MKLKTDTSKILTENLDTTIKIVEMALEKRNAEVKQAIEDVDIELMFTDIKDACGKKMELSDELMEVIGIWWKDKSEELLQKLGLDANDEGGELK